MSDALLTGELLPCPLCKAKLNAGIHPTSDCLLSEYVVGKRGISNWNRRADALLTGEPGMVERLRDGDINVSRALNYEAADYIATLEARVTALIASTGEHITMRSEYLARAEAAESALAQAGTAPEPVAWRWRWQGGDEPDVWAYSETPRKTDQHIYAEPLYAAGTAREARLEAALLAVRNRILDPKFGGIDDTFWMFQSETVVDYIDAALTPKALVGGKEQP